MTKGSKKKFSSITKEKQHEIEAATKKSRLFTIATKLIRKECKIVKSFECQKIVRKMKVLKGDGDGATSDLPSSSTSKRVTNENNSKAQLKISKLEEKLRFTKEFDLDEAVSVCLTRLGLTQKPHKGMNIDTNQDLNVEECTTDDGGINENVSSSLTIGSSKEKEQNETKSTDTSAVSSEGECHIDNEKSRNVKKKTLFNRSLIESILKHNRLISVVKSVNDKISEHRAWLSQREEWLSLSLSAKEENGASRSKKRKGGSEIINNKKTKMNSKEGGIDVLGHDGNSGLFIDSLAGNSRTDVIVENEQERGEFGNHDFGNEDHSYDHRLLQNEKKKKKNRQGQRARKAKAVAIEARKAGHVWDSSLNWRKAKTDLEGGQQRNMEKVDGKRGTSSSTSSGYNSLKKKVVSASGLDPSKNVKISDVAKMGKDWKDEGNAHPSWAAREAQKSKSSVQFTGTKITFD